MDGANDLLVRATNDRAVRILRALDSNLWPAQADPTQIEMVLLHLVINACDAMPNGGTIRIETRNVLNSDPSRPAELATGDGVALVVSDNGVGMSEEVKSRAFDPFFTTKDVGRGSGLGLSMAYGVARQLGGTLQLTSEVGKGTSIAVYLPRSTKVFEAGLSERDQGSLPATGSERILLVDDDPDVRLMVAETMRSLGYVVDDTDNGRAALEMIRRGALVDLLVTDLAMPEFRGEDLIAAVRLIRPTLPILAISGRATSDLSEHNVSLLKKPFVRSDLATCMHDCLRLAERFITKT